MCQVLLWTSVNEARATARCCSIMRLSWRDNADAGQSHLIPVCHVRPRIDSMRGTGSSAAVTGLNCNCRHLAEMFNMRTAGIRGSLPVSPHAPATLRDPGLRHTSDNPRQSAQFQGLSGTRHHCHRQDAESHKPEMLRGIHACFIQETTSFRNSESRATHGC